MSLRAILTPLSQEITGLTNNERGNDETRA